MNIDERLEAGEFVHRIDAIPEIGRKVAIKLSNCPSERAVLAVVIRAPLWASCFQGIGAEVAYRVGSLSPITIPARQVAFWAYR